MTECCVCSRNTAVKKCVMDDCDQHHHPSEVNTDHFVCRECHLEFSCSSEELHTVRECMGSECKNEKTSTRSYKNWDKYDVNWKKIL